MAVKMRSNCAGTVTDATDPVHASVPSGPRRSSYDSIAHPRSSWQSGARHAPLMMVIIISRLLLVPMLFA